MNQGLRFVSLPEVGHQTRWDERGSNRRFNSIKNTKYTLATITHQSNPSQYFFSKIES